MARELPPNAVDVRSRAAWRKWLRANHGRADGAWLVVYKKSSGQRLMSYDDMVEEALCFGWIDSKPRKLDDRRSLLWFAPRKANTGWSAHNKRRVRRLIRDRKMAPAGLALVKQAMADGSWNRLDSVDALEVPSDLLKALREHEGAEASFTVFPRSVKRSILEWIQNAKKEDTRARRILQTARLAARGIRANQWRQ